MPDEPSQYIPPWRLPPEASKIQEPEAVQQPPRENNPVIQEPTGKVSFFKEISASFILVFLPHWFFYLAVNFYDRVDYSLGLSNFPLPQTDPRIVEGIGRGGLYHILIGFTLLLFLIYSIYRLFRHLDKPRTAKFVLSAPLVIFLLFLSIMIITGGDMGQREAKFGLSLYLFIYVLVAYLIIFISNLILSGVKKYNLAFKILALLFVVSLVVPFFVPKLLIRSYEDRIVRSEKVIITKVQFKKVKITKETFFKAEKVYNDYYYDNVERRASGEVVLAKIEDDKFLVQGIVQRSADGDYQKDRADLFVEENQELRSITEGINFIPLYDHLINRNLAAVIISPSRDRIAFLQEDLYIINLDGSGVFIEEKFCPQFCLESWGKDGNLYISIDSLYEKIIYWKVTPPK